MEADKIRPRAERLDRIEKKLNLIQKEIAANGDRLAALEKRVQCLKISMNASGSASDGKHIAEVVSRELQTAVQRKH